LLSAIVRCGKVIGVKIYRGKELFSVDPDNLQRLKTWLSPGFSAVGHGLQTWKPSLPSIGNLCKWA
jgi:hypothetical protein